MIQIDLSQEEEDVLYIIENIATTIQYIADAYAHYYAYSFEILAFEEKSERSSHPLNFHRINFQYFLVIQICKLYENPSPKSPSISSLKTLNKVLYNKYPTRHLKYKEMSKAISSIERTPIYGLLKKLRNKSYAHSDKHEINVPLKFIFINQEETANVKELLLRSIEIFNTCYSLYNTSHGFQHVYNSTTPKNYLNNQFRYKKFFYEFAKGAELRKRNKDMEEVIKLLSGHKGKVLDESVLIEATRKLVHTQEYLNKMVNSAFEHRKISPQPKKQ